MWTYTHEPGAEVRLRQDGHLYFRLRFLPDGGRPFAHPVTLARPGAPALTCLAPRDHPWHAGFWWSWKYIDGVNYWENAPDGSPEGRIRLDGPEELRAGGEHVSLLARYACLDPRRGPVAVEVRRIVWHRPQEGGAHRLDHELAFTAGREALTLDRTPIAPQTPWGGYAGLSWRFPLRLQAVGGLDSEGRRDTAIEHQAAAWATLFGRLETGREPAQGAGEGEPGEGDGEGAQRDHGAGTREAGPGPRREGDAGQGTAAGRPEGAGTGAAAGAGAAATSLRGAPSGSGDARTSWTALAAPAAGGPTEDAEGWAGVAIFDHPENPRHPVPWRYIAEPGFAFLNPSPLLAAPLRVGAGETLVFRHRVLVYAGRADAARLAAEWDRYRAEAAEEGAGTSRQR